MERFETEQDKSTEKLDEIFNEKNKYSFLVGAGASMDAPSSLPSAKMIVRTLLQTYAPTEEVEAISNHEHLRYEHIVEVIQKGFDSDLKFLDYLEIITEPNSIHRFLAKMIIQMNYVMTTNFDYLIEFALKPYCVQKFNTSQCPKPIITENDFLTAINPIEFISRGSWPIYKLHGSKKDIFTKRNTSSSLITTLSSLGKNKEEGKTFDIEPYKKPAIRAITKDRILVIIGYSGSDDFDIGPFLKEITDLKGIIWIEHALKEDNNHIKIQDLHTLKNNQQEISQKHLRLLLEIKEKENIPIYNIKINTKQFIENYLCQRLTKNKQNGNLLKSNDSLAFESFDSWYTRLNISISLLEKYKYAATLFTDLGETNSAMRCYQKGLDLCNEQNDIKNKPYFLNGIGIINTQLGNQHEAIKYYTMSLSLLENFSDEETKFRILLNIGTSNYKIGSYEIAYKMFLQAVSLKAQTTSLTDKAHILGSLGTIYVIRGQSQEAYKNFEESIRISEQIGDLSIKATSLYNLARVERILGQIQKALSRFEEAAKISQELGDWWTYINCLIGIGDVYDVIGHIDKSFSVFKQVLSKTEEIGDIIGQSKALNFIGNFYQRKRDYTTAISYFEKSLMIEEKLNNLNNIATRKNNIGLAYRYLNKLDLAKPLLLEAMKISEQLNNISQLSTRYVNVGSIFEAEKDFIKALDYYKKALTTSIQIGDVKNEINALINISGSYTDLRKFAEAIENYKIALIKARNHGFLINQAEILNNIAIILYRDMKNLDESYKYLQESLNVYKEAGIQNRIIETSNNLQLIKNKLEKSR